MVRYRGKRNLAYTLARYRNYYGDSEVYSVHYPTNVTREEYDRFHNSGWGFEHFPSFAREMLEPPSLVMKSIIVLFPSYITCEYIIITVIILTFLYLLCL